MQKITSFIAPTTLEIVALLFCALFVLTFILFAAIIAMVIYYSLPFQIEFDVFGYDILITQKSSPHSGCGIMFTPRIKLWHINRMPSS